MAYFLENILAELCIVPKPPIRTSKCSRFRYKSQYFSISDLQFGFKPGISTSMCTGSIKNIVSCCLSRDSRVFGCFLDASKAFDLVNHTLLFQLLLDRCLPKPIVLFFLNWYSSQQVSVKWSSSLSAPFTVSNGVRQGGVLSPILFAIIIY